MSHNRNEALGQARADRAAAERDRRSLLGELVEALRAKPGQYSRRVGAILEKIERTEGRIQDATEAIGRALEGAAPESRADASMRDRVNALVAVHVEGLELVADQWTGGTRWLQVDPHTKKHRPVANYTGDHGAARRALETFPRDTVAAVACRLVCAGSDEPAVVDVLTARPPALCLAMLEVLGISPTADVPTIAH